MSILTETNSPDRWQEFLLYKTEKSHISKRDEIFLKDFIENQKYKTITEKIIIHENYCFSIPVKRLLNRHGKSKKRVIYTFSETENIVLKLITHLLYRYDNTQPANCYSFRRHFGAKKAITALIRDDGGKKYSCKIDIRDYFNKIDVELLMPILNAVLCDDRPLFEFLKKLLTADKAVFNNETITEKRGAMAGTPISPFLANIYLAEMDRFFLNSGIPYARYSDDIIFFTDTMETLDEYLLTVKNFLGKYHLEINHEKVKITEPGQAWEYLGISFGSGKTGLSRATVKKIKGKIRRKARSIYRWKIRKNADNEKAMRVFARVLNRKFFGGNDIDFTWTRWFFPLINTDSDLKEIDAYIQEYMRFICTGRFSRTNFRTRYNDLKNCGYKNLVNEFYKYKQDRTGQ